jgi:hypothetical protein
MIWIALPLVLWAIVAALVCRWLGATAHLREMIIAAAIALIAAEAALLPVTLGKGLPQALNAQAGLVATMLHLFICIVGGFVAALFSGPANRSALLLWMLPFYWITLSALIVIVVRAIRAAAPSSAAPANS